jgi:hypothetical protein
MFGLFDKITEFFQEIFIGIIQANLEAMFLDINENVSLVATEVGKTPSGWNAEVFSFVKNINDTVVIPIAGIIITAVLCIELINMVMEKNNMHSDTDTFDFFKYIIKMWIAVWFVSNAFTFVFVNLKLYHFTIENCTTYKLYHPIIKSINFL